MKLLEQQLQSLEAQKVTQQTDTKDISLEQSSKLRIDATVIESHVNLKIQCPKKQGQLLRSIIWLEKLRFTVLHLNVTSPCNATVSYSFNLKVLNKLYALMKNKNQYFCYFSDGRGLYFDIGR